MARNENTVHENLIPVDCPACRARFRINPKAVPEEGAWAVCKKCGRRFFIPKRSAGPHPAKPREVAYTCPKCGRRQSQAFTCYACGTDLQPEKAGTPIRQKTQRENGPSMPPMGQVVVRAHLSSGRWLQSATRISIDIDGMDYTREWGTHTFPVLEGECGLAANGQFLFRSFGRSSLTLTVPRWETMYVDYIAPHPLSGAPGKIRSAALTEGALWQVSAGQNQPSAKRPPSKRKVVLSLIFLGPLGFFALWKSDAFSFPAKVAITTAMVLFLFWIFSIL